MIKDFLILNCIGNNDKIGLKVNNEFFFYAPDKKISIYVLGDDFQPGGSIREVLQTIDRINIEDANGDRLVRIHGIGFPTIFAGPRRFQQSVYRYSTLMREMTIRNGGTFVGLNDYQ